MVPKTKLKYSWLYNSVFIKDFKREKARKLSSKCKNFEKLYDNNIKEILKLIEKHSQKWDQIFIPIYIIEKGPIFADPLTIRYEKDPKIMLIRLIHELIHNNINNKKFKNDYILHVHMDRITRNILSELSVNLNSHFYILEKMTDKFKRRS